MEIKEIEKIMIAMNDHQIHKVEIKNKNGEVLIEKKTGAPVGVAASVVSHAPPPPVAAEVSTPSKTEPEGNFVTSPIVGTYYASPSPDAAAFVKPGDKVSADTVVCIVEAMKVMNEVKAGMSGVVAEVLVNSGDPVEFGTKILRIT